MQTVDNKCHRERPIQSDQRYIDINYRILESRNGEQHSALTTVHIVIIKSTARRIALPCYG